MAAAAQRFHRPAASRRDDRPNHAGATRERTSRREGLKAPGDCEVSEMTCDRDKDRAREY